MRFTATIALVAALVPAALAQSVTIDPVTLTQCADSTITIEGSSGPYYVAVIPASDPCTEDALAEFYNVTGDSVDYYVNLAAGTTVQIYVLDVNGVENWGQIETVGDGDSSCLPGSNATASPSSDPVDDVPTNTTVPAVPTSSSSYVPPPPPPTTSAAPTPSSSSTSHTPADDNTSTSDADDNSGTASVSSDTSGDNTNTPANAADNTGGASSLTASFTLIIGAFVAVIALF
jgi:hypothetical protein